MTNTNETDAPSTEQTRDIVATADNWDRGKKVVIALVLIVYCGGFFLYDGFIGWPDRNQKLDQLDKQRDRTTDSAEKVRLTSEMEKLGGHKSSLDILLQKVIGFIALPAGVWYLINTFRKSRGEIRISGSTVYVPGHPPIPLESITAVDNRRWQKKGIAVVEYSLPGQPARKFTLDDFIYRREPTDKIYDAILAYVVPEEESPTDEQAKAVEPPSSQ